MARLPIPGADQNIWGNVLNEYLTQAHAPDGQLKDSVVTAAKLQDNAVTTAKIISNAVATAKIQDAAVTDVKLADDAVATPKLQDESVTTEKLASGVQSALAAAISEIAQEKQWIVAGPVNVAAVDVDYIGPAYITIPTGASAVITGVRARINSGTSATVQVTRNGVAVAGLESVNVTTSGVTITGLSVSLANGDLLAPVVQSTSGSPQNMTFAITYTVTN